MAKKAKYSNFNKSKKKLKPDDSKKENVGVLILKLGRPYGMTTRRLHILLQQSANNCVKVCNAGLMHWYTFRTQNPEWKPGDYYEAPPRRIKVKASEKEPKDSILGPHALLSRAMYYDMQETAPSLATSIVSACNQKILGVLKTKNSYRDRERGFKGFFRWQSILLAESSLPNFRNLQSIPIPGQNIKLSYTDDDCSIRFPLLSNKSGYGQQGRSPRVRVSVKSMTCGQRRILRKLVDGNGEVKDQDGKLLLKLVGSTIKFAPSDDGQTVKSDEGEIYPGGSWYMMLTYKFATLGSTLPRDRVLEIEPCGIDDNRPFRAYWTDEETGERQTWDIGNGLPLVKDYQRIQAKRAAIRQRRYGGHGCRKQAKRTRGASNYIKNLSDRFCKLAVSNIIKQAQRTNCGTILYREPTMPVRDESWFTQYDVSMPWFTFEQKIAAQCKGAGINYEKVRIGKKEWLTRYGRKKAG